MATRYTMGPKATGTPTGRAVVAKFTQPRRAPLPAIRFGSPGTVGPRTLVSSRGFPGAPTPGRPATAPGSATAPPASAGTSPGAGPPPPDPQYDAAVAIAQRNRDARLAALSGQRAQTLNEYGFTPQTDAAGNVTAIAFDPTNHFSRAALMKKAWNQKRAGATNSYAARGQLYAGSLQNAQDDANRGELQSDDALKRALLAFIAANTSAGTTARTDYENSVAQAEGDRLARVADNPLYEPSGPGETPAAPLPSTAGAAAAAAAGTSAATTRATRSRDLARQANARATAARVQRARAHPKPKLPRVRLKPGRSTVGPKTQRP